MDPAESDIYPARATADEVHVLVRLMQSMPFPSAVRWLDTPHAKLDGRTPADALRAGEASRVSELVDLGVAA